MRVLGDIMTKDLKTISPDASVEAAAKKMRDNHISSLLVEEAGNYIGVLTETDVVKKVVAEGKDLFKTKVKMVMTSSIISMDFSRPLIEAYESMAAKQFRHLPVTKDGKIIGLVSAKDLMAYIQVVAA